MSQTETNPNFNPTTTVTLPKQQQQIMEPKVIDFTQQMHGQDNNLKLNCQQIDWIKLASKNKFIDKAVWNIDDDNSWYRKEIDPGFLKSLMQIGRDYQTFYSFDKVMISLQPTHQAFFQGNTKFAFDPSPSPSYYSDVLGYTLTLESFYQFQTVDFSPKSTQSYNFLFPMNMPFAFLQLPSDAQFNGNTETYLDNYNMGRLRSAVFSTLTTKGTATSISYHVSGQIINLKTEGMFYQ